MSTIYERRPDDFERHAANGAYNALLDRPAVLELLGDVDGQRVLDAGCGPGLYADELLARGASVVGFDQSAGMVELAQSRLGDRAELLRVHDLSQPLDWLADQTFDAVVLALVIHHLDDRRAVLRELFRVLRPGGRLVLSTAHPMEDWLNHGGSYFDVELVEEVWKDDWDMRYWRQPLTATCAEATDAGFLIERLVEPQPSEELCRRFPEVHAKLAERPAFVMLRLLRPR
ncbi:class I SAM-dependent methyltransferase [Actinopolymorpha sp. B11F2]|uniref:class I SAM-dependent methyltransferase n=1 Tax=Actinopolymorpha sp. B11F2 TaxID=3160862 RepID=UPI0032E3887C